MSQRSTCEVASSVKFCSQNSTASLLPVQQNQGKGARKDPEQGYSIKAPLQRKPNRIEIYTLNSHQKLPSNSLGCQVPVKRLSLVSCIREKDGSQVLGKMEMKTVSPLIFQAPGNKSMG